MRTPKTKPSIAITFPPPSRHKITVGDVLSLDGKVVVIHDLPKGEVKAKCFDQTGKACSIERDRLEEKFYKLGIKDAKAFQKQIVRMLKNDKGAVLSAKSSAPAQKRATKKVAANPPAPGPNPTLN